MNKHTQGPWHNNGADIFQGGKKDRLIAFCGYGATNEIEANACLIAAAPELLEALKIIIQFYSDNIENMPVAFQTFADLAEQAIKKAKGE